MVQYLYVYEQGGLSQIWRAFCICYALAIFKGKNIPLSYWFVLAYRIDNLIRVVLMLMKSFKNMLKSRFRCCKAIIAVRLIVQGDVKTNGKITTRKNKI